MKGGGGEGPGRVKKPEKEEQPLGLERRWPNVKITFLSFLSKLTVPDRTSVTIPVTAEERGKRKICR